MVHDDALLLLAIESILSDCGGLGMRLEDFPSDELPTWPSLTRPEWPPLTRPESPSAEWSWAAYAATKAPGPAGIEAR